MIDPILHDIKKFLKRTGMARTQFGRRAVNSTCLVYRLENGSEPRRETRAKIQSFIAAWDRINA